MKVRMEHVLNELLHPTREGGALQMHDIIGFQEMFNEETFINFKNRLLPYYPYSRRFESGLVVGSGLVIFSRFPIIRSAFHPFALNGRPEFITQCDYYSGKGVGWVLIEHPEAGVISVSITHLVADYSTDGGFSKHDNNLVHRLTQAYQLATISERYYLSYPDAIHLIVGDFNIESDSLPYRTFLDSSTLSGFRGVTDGLHRDDFITANALDNTYRNTGSTPISIDKIIYHQGRLELLTVQRAFTSKFITKDGRSLSYSDHYGISATFTVNASQSQSAGTSLMQKHHLIGTVRQMVKDEILLCNSRRQLYTGLYICLLFAVVLLMFLPVSSYLAPLITILSVAALALALVAHLYYNYETATLEEMAQGMSHLLLVDDIGKFP